MQSTRIFQTLLVSIFASIFTCANVVKVLETNPVENRGIDPLEFSKDGPVTFRNITTELEMKIEKIEVDFQELKEIKNGRGISNQILADGLPLRQLSVNLETTTTFQDLTTEFDQSEVDILFGLQLVEEEK